MDGTSRYGTEGPLFRRVPTWERCPWACPVYIDSMGRRRATVAVLWGVAQIECACQLRQQCLRNRVQGVRPCVARLSRIHALAVPPWAGLFPEASPEATG